MHDVTIKIRVIHAYRSIVSSSNSVLGYKFYMEVPNCSLKITCANAAVLYKPFSEAGKICSGTCF